MPFTHSTPIPVYFEAHGPADAAETIVFAHGAGGNAGIWFNQVAHFRADYRVLTFDHRGFGRTRLPDDPLTVQQFRDDLIALLDENEIASAHLVGQSMGGFTCLRTTLDHPDRVRTLTFSATSGGIHNPEPNPAVARLTSSANDASGVLLTMAASSRENAPLMQLYEAMNNFNVDFAWSNLSRLLGKEDVVQWETLSRVAAPVLFIAGAEDPLFPPEMLASYVPHFPDARIEVIDDAGHSPYFEQPTLFNQVLQSHLQDHLASGEAIP